MGDVGSHDAGTGAEEAVLRAVAAHRAGNLNEAEALYRAILELAPWEHSARLRLAVLLAQRGDHGAARDMLSEALARHPGEAAFHGGLAMVCVMGDDLDQAIASLAKATELDPNDPEFHGCLGVLLSHVDGHLNAVASATRAAQVAPRSPTFRWILGDILAAAGNLNAAVASYDEALYLDARLVKVHRRRGSVLAALDRSDEALAACREALDLEPGNFDTLFYMGNILLSMGRPADAVNWYQQALLAEPTSDAGLAERGLRCLLEGRLAESLAWILTARAKRAGHADNYQALSCAHAKLRQFREAAAATRKALRFPVVRSQPCTGEEKGSILCLLSTEDTFYRLRKRRIALGRFTNLGRRLNSDLFAVHFGFITGTFLDDIAAASPSYDLILNSIADPDGGAADLAVAKRFVHDAAVPVINLPAKVGLLRRDRLSATLTDIPGLVVPDSLRLDLDGADPVHHVTAAMTTHDFAYPVLLHPIAPQGLAAPWRVDHPDTLAERLAEMEAKSLYLTRYVECRTDGGLYRRFRAFVIDGVLYPSHLVFGRDWPLHRTARDSLAPGEEWTLAEERHYLAESAASIGEIGSGALKALGERTGLDVMGVDFTILDDGRLLIFDVGPKLSFTPGDTERYPYLKGGYRAIQGAINDLILSRLDGNGLDRNGTS